MQSIQARIFSVMYTNNIYFPQVIDLKEQINQKQNFQFNQERYKKWHLDKRNMKNIIQTNLDLNRIEKGFCKIFITYTEIFAFSNRQYIMYFLINEIKINFLLIKKEIDFTYKGFIIQQKIIKIRMENINKSIIYGNIHQNKYGKFLPICSFINDRNNVTSILDYIHQSVHFKKYNRIAYAYHVEQIPIVFITQKKNIQAQYYQDCHSDQTIQGSGQKLLHLLEKFNVKNVFIACLIQQFNPLLPFQTTNYRAIVQNSRILLDELYKKVINLKDKYSQNKSLGDLVLKDKTVPLKKCDLTQNNELDKVVSEQTIIPTRQRPNHIYTKGKPSFLSSQKKLPPSSSSTYEIKFMWSRCKLMRQQFTQLKQTITQKQIQQLRYFVMYDKNGLINLVVKLFTIYEGLTKEQLMTEYQFQNIKKMDFEVIQKDKLTKMEDMIKSHKKLNVDSILKINRAMGMLFSMIELKIKFSKMFNRIAQIMQKSALSQNDIKQIDMNSQLEKDKIQIKTFKNTATKLNA